MEITDFLKFELISRIQISKYFDEGSEGSEPKSLEPERSTNDE
jgi:hypothetical protein